MKGFSKLCTPARIYFAIAVIAAVVSLFYGATLMSEFFKLLFAFIWTFLLSWLCDKGFVSISWFLVLLPYVLMLLAMLNIYHTTEQQRQLMRAIKLQGAFGREPFGKYAGREGATTMNNANANANAAPSAPAGDNTIGSIVGKALQSQNIKNKVQQIGSQIGGQIQDLINTPL